MRSSGDSVRSALCSVAPGSSDAGSRLLHNLHAAACVVLCGGTPRACPQPLCSWAASESGQHGSIAHSTARSFAMAACSPSSPSSQPARPPFCTAHPAAHTSSRDTSPRGRRCLVPLRTHAPPSRTRPRWRGSRTRMRMRRSPAMWQLQAASRRQQLVLAGTSVPGPHSLGPMGDAARHRAPASLPSLDSRVRPCAQAWTTTTTPSCRQHGGRHTAASWISSSRPRCSKAMASASP